MKSQLVSGTADAQVHVVILDSGEEAFAALTKFPNDKKLAAASLTAIGRLREGDGRLVRPCFEELQEDRGRANRGEVLSAVGDISTGDDGKASLHITSCSAV